jgi:tryptophan-rich sensory protein
MNVGKMTLKIIPTLSKLLISILPILSIFILGIFFPADKQPYRPIFQPPNLVFPIIWTYITLAFGILTSYSLDKVIHKIVLLGFYFVILSLLNIWLVLNSNEKYQEAFYLLVSTSYLSVLYLMYLSYEKISGVLFLVPLPFWLILASCLNGVIYDREG